MKLFIYYILIKPNVIYTKWFIYLTKKEEKFKEEISEEISINFQKQYGGLKVY